VFITPIPLLSLITSSFSSLPIPSILSLPIRPSYPLGIREEGSSILSLSLLYLYLIYRSLISSITILLVHLFLFVPPFLSGNYLIFHLHPYPCLIAGAIITLSSIPITSSFSSLLFSLFYPIILSLISSLFYPLISLLLSLSLFSPIYISSLEFLKKGPLLNCRGYNLYHLSLFPLLYYLSLFPLSSYPRCSLHRSYLFLYRSLLKLLLSIHPTLTPA
jgi:hypothetical protein